MKHINFIYHYESFELHIPISISLDLQVNSTVSWPVRDSLYSVVPEWSFLVMSCIKYILLLCTTCQLTLVISHCFSSLLTLFFHMYHPFMLWYLYNVSSMQKVPNFLPNALSAEKPGYEIVHMLHKTAELFLACFACFGGSTDVQLELWLRSAWADDCPCAAGKQESQSVWLG